MFVYLTMAVIMSILWNTREGLSTRHTPFRIPVYFVCFNFSFIHSFIYFFFLGGGGGSGHCAQRCESAVFI